MEYNFEKILNPVGSNKFRADFYTKKGILIKGYNDKFKGLFSYEDLNNLLNSSPIPHPTLKLVKEVKPITPTSFTSIINACKNGASLIVDEIENYVSSISKLSKLFTLYFGEHTRVNMYLGQPDVKGFSNHYDTHDVFIFQTEGKKKWRVYEPTINFPIFNLKQHGKNSPKIPYIDCILEPGDLLYIPRGHWHEAVASEVASMHLTLGIYIKTGIDFLNWVVDEMRDTEFCRMPLPLLYPEERNNFEIQQEYINKLSELFISKLKDKYLLDDFKKHNVATEKRYEPFNLPFQFIKNDIDLNEKTFIRDDLHSYLIEESNENEYKLIIYNRVLKFNNSTRSLIDFILSKNEFSFEQIISKDFNLTKEQINKLLNVLIKESIIKIK